MAEALIVYEFHRADVERGDFSHFLGLYAPAQLPTGADLCLLMNQCIFLIDGYNEDSREINSIPEVRQFYQAFHKAWPFWHFFCSLDTEEFRMNVLCCLPSLSVLKVEGNPNAGIKYDRIELLNFVSEDFGPMNEMCERAGMSERQIYDRSKAVFEYFDMPFNAEPPP
jgi:hypothetical protein